MNISMDKASVGAHRTPARLERYTRIRSKNPTNKSHHPHDMLPGRAFLHPLPHPSSSSSLSCPPTPDPEPHLPPPLSHGRQAPGAMAVSSQLLCWSQPLQLAELGLG